MPISVKNESHDSPSWNSASWAIDNEALLAEHIARVALGQYRHVLKILEKTGVNKPKAPASAYQGAKELLTVPSGKPSYNRDGWVFQVIAWIAAHTSTPERIIRQPHIRHADKGFDGIHLRMKRGKRKIRAAVICEEKATINPRNTVREDVWPEFLDFETGRRDHELIHEITTLLEHYSKIDPDQAIEKVIWDDAREYRISLTRETGRSHKTANNKIFKDFEKIVKGKTSRRSAEILAVPEIRQWIDQLACKSVKTLEQWEAENV